MKKLPTKKEYVNLLSVKPAISGVVKTVKQLDVLKKEREVQKKLILFIFNSIIESSKLTKDERKQVSSAVKLLIKKGI